MDDMVVVLRVGLLALFIGVLVGAAHAVKSTAATVRPALRVVMVEPLFVADHRALDLLNTVLQVGGAEVDVLQSDDDVARWLVKAEVLATPMPRKGLRKAFRELREVIRQLVDRRRAHKRLDLAALNAFLAQGRQEPVLVQDRTGEVRLEQRFASNTAEQLLMPVALDAAELLANGDFDLVRVCESDDCVLHFYDRTRSHHRRWCSMATCGNRAKVQMFRARRRG
jgi:predicted RNA-binding Zn ribbon-like protein